MAFPTPSNTTSAPSQWVQTIYDTSALFAYRAANVFRAAADVHKFNGQPTKGVTVNIEFVTATSLATTALTENADVTPVGLARSASTITMTEYGNSETTSRKMRFASFIDIDMAVVHEMTLNMEESMDVVARIALDASSNVLRPGAVAEASLAATDVITANLLRQNRNKLTRANVPPHPSFAPYFPTFLHPDVSFDLQIETGLTSWLAPAVYSLPGEVISGEIGAFTGLRVIENSNCKLSADVNGTVDGYFGYTLGAQALGELVGEPQHIVVGPVIDSLSRFQPVGWYALMGYGLVRTGDARLLETASSIGAN